ncbi:helix-turn-helix transcriptional regulator [Streptomyces sp. NPDC049954]|uniref:helix-turn-helix domain-containing protein n=1 Tax=Streptomyces sp. NPDC049954 TaxID=3155779 RepID=UPI003434BD6B
MPVSSSAPTMRQRRLARTLKELRIAAGLKHSDAAAILTCAESKLTRIENAKSGIRLLDLRTLLDAYGVTDQAKRDEVEQLAKDARKKGWWAQYSRKIASEYLGYISVEWDSSEMYSVETFLIPGLLQTPAYTKAVTRMQMPESGEAYAEEQAALKQERQRILDRDEPFRLWVVITEAVLHAEVGGPAVRKQQLGHLLTMSEHSSVELQVLPMSSPSNALLFGAFAVLRFDGTGDVVFAEQEEGTIYYEEPAAAERFGQRFRRLNMAALSPEASRSLIAEVADGLPAASAPQPRKHLSQENL